MIHLCDSNPREACEARKQRSQPCGKFSTSLGPVSTKPARNHASRLGRAARTPNQFRAPGHVRMSSPPVRCIGPTAVAWLHGPGSSGLPWVVSQDSTLIRSLSGMRLQTKLGQPRVAMISPERGSCRMICAGARRPLRVSSHIDFVQLQCSSWSLSWIFCVRKCHGSIDQ